MNNYFFQGPVFTCDTTINDTGNVAHKALRGSLQGTQMGQPLSLQPQPSGPSFAEQPWGPQPASEQKPLPTIAQGQPHALLPLGGLRAGLQDRAWVQFYPSPRPML